MPMHFFHVEDGTSTPDSDGVELKDVAEAKCAAVKMAGRIICDAASDFWNRAEWKMTVADHTGLTLCTLNFVGTEAPATSLRAYSGRAA